jgi:multidrug efflux pump subunit AcrA (membrane-fusion protein)
MTQKLSELFNLPPADETTVEAAEHTIEENREMIEAVDLAIDKIDAALPMVSDLDTSDDELDELSDLAKEKFQDLIDLGMNVEARFSGHILATAGTLLGHAITAKQAKLDKKLRMVDLQLKKARLDLQIKQAEEKGQSDGNKLLNAEDGQGVVLDRNELLKQLLDKK